MDITAIIKNLLTLDLKPLTAGGAALKVGDQLSGTVVEQRGESTVLVDFGRFRALSEVRFPVQVGQKLPLTVVNTSGQLELKLNTRLLQAQNAKSDAAAGRGVPNRVLRELASHVENLRGGAANLPTPQKLPPSVDRALGQLVRQLAPLSMEKPVDQIADRIRTLVERSGHLFEKNMETAVRQSAPKGEPPADASQTARPAIQSVIQQDLKPGLLLLREFLTDNPKIVRSHGETAVRQVLADVEQLLGDQESQQNRVMEKRDSSDPFQMFAHTLPLKSGKDGIKLNVFYPKKQKEGGHKHPQISILLEMDRLGAVRSDLVLIGRDLNVTFFVTSPEIESVIAERLREVQAALTPFFEHVGLHIKVSEEKISQLHTEHLQPTGGHKVDLKA